MTIIFDLDYTLFDVQRFKKYLARALEISLEMYNNDYDKYFKQTKTNYSLARHLSILVQKNEVKNRERIRRNIKKLWQDIDKFLFSSAKKVLCELKKNNHQLYLVTFGEKSWQKEKVENLKIKKYFNKIFYCSKNKSVVLKKLYKEKDFIIVNDNVKECIEINKILPFAKILIVKGPYSKNVKHNFLNINLKSIEKYL